MSLPGRAQVASYNGRRYAQTPVESLSRGKGYSSNNRDSKVQKCMITFIQGQVLCLSTRRSLRDNFVLRGDLRGIVKHSPEHSWWKKELPRVTMEGRSSTRWSFTTLEPASGPARVLSWASSYRSPIAMGNTATPAVLKEQERVRGQ